MTSNLFEPGAWRRALILMPTQKKGPEESLSLKELQKKVTKRCLLTFHITLLV